jgi:hypothetical protein
MTILPASEAHFVRSSPSRYQEGVYFLAQIVERCLANAFFYHRLEDQIASGRLHGVKYEQARYSSIAIHDSIVADFHKLAEKRKDTWNLWQLHKEWSKYQNDTSLQKKVISLIMDLELRFKSLSTYRHDQIAHQSKSLKMTQLTALPRRIIHLDKIVQVVDLFVDGEIPYSLYLHESGEEIDLRKGLNI